MTPLQVPHNPLFIIIVLLLVGLPARAAEYFVGSGGNDQAVGTRSEPWRTVQRAADAVTSGDTITVLSGDFSDQVPQIKKSGTKENPIVIQSDEKHGAQIGGMILLGDYLSIRGFKISGDHKENRGHGIYAGMVSDAKHPAQTGCEISGNLLTNLSGTAITSGRDAVVRNNIMRRVHRGLFVNGGTLVEENEIDTLTAPIVDKKPDGNLPARQGPKKTSYAFFAGDNITFRNNHWHGTYDGQDGVPPLNLFYTWGTDFFTTWDAGGIGSSNNILIEKNRCFYATHGVEPLARDFQKSHGIIVRNNLFVNTCYVGVFPQKWTGVVVENNTLINCGAYPVWSRSEIQSRGMVVRNNLISVWKPEELYANGFTRPESGIRFDQDEWKKEAMADFNLIHGYQNRNYGKNDVNAEPGFVDPDAGDFRLKPGSPGIDAGTSIPEITTDLPGRIRPVGKAYDIGAYETQGSEP